MRAGWLAADCSRRAGAPGLRGVGWDLSEIWRFECAAFAAGGGGGGHSEFVLRACSASGHGLGDLYDGFERCAGCPDARDERESRCSRPGGGNVMKSRRNAIFRPARIDMGAWGFDRTRSALSVGPGFAAVGREVGELWRIAWAGSGEGRWQGS